MLGATTATGAHTHAWRNNSHGCAYAATQHNFVISTWHGVPHTHTQTHCGRRTRAEATSPAHTAPPHIHMHTHAPAAHAPTPARTSRRGRCFLAPPHFVRGDAVACPPPACPHTHHELTQLPPHFVRGHVHQQLHQQLRGARRRAD
eukprot:41529-Chlamydomonas_euryale.AAC.1